MHSLCAWEKVERSKMFLIDSLIYSFNLICQNSQIKFYYKFSFINTYKNIDLFL